MQRTSDRTPEQAPQARRVTTEVNKENQDFQSGVRENKESNDTYVRIQEQQPTPQQVPRQHVDLIALLKDSMQNLNSKLDTMNDKISTKIENIERNYEDLNSKIDVLNSNKLRSNTGNFGETAQNKEIEQR